MEGKASGKALGGTVRDGPRAQQASKAGWNAAWGEEGVGEPVTRGCGKGFGKDPNLVVNSERPTCHMTVIQVPGSRQLSQPC